MRVAFEVRPKLRIGERVYYGLMHVPSGDLMRQNRYSKGYTQQEFPLQKSDKRPVRLFLTKRGAKQARLWWLKGVSTSMHGHEYQEEITTSPRLDRKPGDLVVVEILVAAGRIIE